jgi:SET domain-containing protein
VLYLGVPSMLPTNRPRRSRRSPPIVVQPSPIQGSGVFATRAIDKGERIVEYVGERISHAEADVRYDDEAMERHHTFLFSIDKDTCIDGNVGGNDARYINHSCAPNAYSLADGERIFIVAGKAIRAGEEILYDYAYTTEPTDTLEFLRRVYPCRCGAAKCRGTLADIPVDVKPAAKRAATKTTKATKKKRTRR